MAPRGEGSRGTRRSGLAETARQSLHRGGCRLKPAGAAARSPGFAGVAIMPSPFPGMNPYLEQADVWHDFHQRFVPYLAGLIGPQLANHYVVKVDDQIYIREPSAEQRMFFGRGDAFVAERQPSAA